MLFNSIGFAVFFPTVVLIYFWLDGKPGWEGKGNAWLLAASYFYYACADPRYALLLLSVTGITYAAGLATGDGTLPSGKRRAALIAGVAANLSILFFFKYFNLLAGLFQKDPALKILLPVGISFYIFQSLTYLFDTYGGKCRIQKDFLKYALFVSFFPVLLAGPIERASDLLPQFDERHRFDYERVRHGLFRMACGYFMKLVIAQRLAISVDLIYGHYGDCTGYQLFLATVLYAFQIYCDFASYSAIAVGAGEVMGFRLMENFRQPFLSRSLGEFWRRWHISLNSWFRDYLYIPLGGSRKGRLRKYLNVLIVFTLSGAWHGAELHYILWGALSGLLQVLGDMLKPVRKKACDVLRLKKALEGKPGDVCRILLTFFFFTVSLVFFRAGSVAEAVQITGRIWTRFEVKSVLSTSPFALGLGSFHLLFLAAGLGMMILFDLVNEKRDAIALLLSQKKAVRWTVYYLMVLMMLGSASLGSQQFIYFAF